MQPVSERGAVLIHVAIMLTFLIAVTAFAADYGMLFVSRSQAQSAADAGALAGAYGLAFNEGDVPARQLSAGDDAWHTAHFHTVWTEHPAVTTATPYATSTGYCKDTPTACIRVDVWRDGSNGGNTLPTWFGHLFGYTTQRTKAMAVAQTQPASGSNCLKPWLIPDKFINNVGGPKFDAGDVYTPPTKSPDGTIDNGTGYTPDDIGTVVVLNPGNPHQTISPSDYYEIDDPEFSLIGGKDYQYAISHCLLRRSVGDTISVKPGATNGPTTAGFEDLIAASPNGEAIIMIGMFDPAAFEAQKRDSGNFDITIVNMLAMKVDANSMDNNGTITATIVGSPSSMLEPCSTGPCPTSTGLLSIIRLVR
jgi:hypothetical protein